ncbi:uncharacterized protein [Hemitrygon akajei]|uniref:uncharacterized protein n=1 Tax=Hemitrygon akajei TaxID=2704970 RepID=UPI003BF951EF
MNQASVTSTIYPFNFEHSLPLVSKATKLTEVTPAKKITFFKSGDPQFSGVKMAINKRTFKTFDALLDDLTKKVSLPFGVRTVTTPHGVHNINSLEQLEDGGTYLCSDRRHIKPIHVNASGRKPIARQSNNPTSAHQYIAQRARQEERQMHRVQTAHKKITLIKNGNVGIHYSIVLNKRNLHNFKNFLEEISELLQYNVTKLYTMDGRSVGTLQALLQSPNVLVCVGHEAFKPIVYDDIKRPAEKWPGLSRRSQTNSNNDSADTKINDNFGLETKKSIIHPRSPSHSSRYSLSSEKFYHNALNLSSGNNGHASFMDSQPRENNPKLTDSMIDDNIEKRVHMNKDGSLSVEMKVRFRLLNRETLQWSTQIRRSSLAGKNMNERLCSVEDCATEETDQKNCFDQSFYPCHRDDIYVSNHNGAEPEEHHCESCCNCCQGYDIWKNPSYSENITEVNSRNGRYTHSTYSSASSGRHVAYKRESVESVQTMSSEEHTHFVQRIERHSETFENGNEGGEYCSLSRCSSHTGGYTPTSKSVGHHESRASVSRSQSAAGYTLYCSTNNSYQNLCDEDTSCVSACNSICSSKGRTAVKLTESAENGKLAASFTGSAEAPVNLKDADVKEGDDKQENNSSELFHCAKCKKKIKQEDNSEAKSQNASSNGSKCSIKDYKESVALNHEHSSTKSSSPTQFNSKINGTINIGDTEGGKAVSVVSSCSIHSDNISDREINEDNRPASDISSSSAKSKPGSHSETDLNELESHSTPEVHSINYDSHERPVSNRTCSSSKNKQLTNMDAEDYSISCSLTTSLGSLTDGKDNSLSCSEGLSGKRATSTHSASVSKHAKRIVINSDDKHRRSSASLNDSLSDCRSRAEKAAPEDDGSSSLCVCDHPKPNLKAVEDGKMNNEDKTLPSTPDFQVESNIRMEQERSKSASSICSGNSKASGIKAAEESQELQQEPEQKCISKFPTGSTVEVLCCEANEETATEIHTGAENASVQSVPRSSESKGKACGKSTPHLLTEPSQKSKSSLTPDKLTNKTGSASRPTTSGAGSIITEGSACENLQKEKSIRSDHDRKSEKGSGEQKYKHNNNTEKNKNKKSTHAVRDSRGKNDPIPGVLPSPSLEEVIHEWLKNIPSENMLLKYDSSKEFQDKCERSAACVTEGEQAEETTGTLEEKSHEESTVSNFKLKEDNSSEVIGLECSSNPKTEDKISVQPNVNDVDILQSKPASSCSSITKQPQDNILPSGVHSPAEVIKGFLSSRQRVKLDRSNSLPDLNLAHEKKLSHSAKALLMCLVGLQFFDKDSSDSANKFNNVDSSPQKELLHILKLLWYTDITKEDEGEVSRTAVKHSKTSKGHNSADDNITPVSSSGVDVNSGSGGSGDSCVSGARDVSPVAEKEQHLKVQSCASKADDTSKQNKPCLMTNSSEEGFEVCTKPNEKKKENSISSIDSAMTNASQRKPKLKHHRNAKNKSEDSNDIEIRSPSRSSKLSQSDIALFSPVTPDIACRVQWNSVEQSSDEDLVRNVENTATGTQDTTQNAQEPHAPGAKEMKSSVKNSFDTEETIHQNKAEDHNEAISVGNLEGMNIAEDKTTENVDSTVKIKASQEITSDHAVQVVKEEQKLKAIERKSSDPDPVWLLRLLKKLEKQFIAHYIDAMNDFKVRWNLQDDQRLDSMIEDLREDVSRRIQGSIEREFRKVQGRAGKKKPVPPQEPRRCESSEQTEQRRRRLKAMYKMQTCSPHSKDSDHEQSTNEISSVVRDEDLNLHPTAGDKVNIQGQCRSYKFCTCDTCKEKYKAPKSVANPTQKNTSIFKNFDLKEILMMKMNSPNEQITKQTVTDRADELLNQEIEKNGCNEGETLEAVQNNTNNAEVNENQENANVNNTLENQKLDTIMDQREEVPSSSNHELGENLEDIGEKIKQVDTCNNDEENKSEGGELPKVISIDGQKNNEDQGDGIYNSENLQQCDKVDPQCEAEDAEDEAGNNEHNNEEASPTTKKCNGQNEEDNSMPNNTDPDTRNYRRLEEPDSKSQLEENNTSEIGEKNVRREETQNLDINASESADEPIISDVVNGLNEEVQDMNAELVANESLINRPQLSGKETSDDSTNAHTADNIQSSAKEATRSSSNSSGNKTTQMYPESSSDEDRGSLGTSPEVSEDEKDTKCNSDPAPDQSVSIRNQTKKPSCSELNEFDLDF